MRHAEVGITYNKVDISKNIKGDLLSFAYDEVAEGSGDSLSFSLQNKGLKWLNEWYPIAGDTIWASLTSYDWNKLGEIQKLECGIMPIDSPEFSGPPDTVTLKALNMPTTEGFNDVAEDGSWEYITLYELGQKIANKYGMEFVYDSDLSIMIRALKRTNQTDPDFLKSTAEKYGLCLKIFSNRIILYSKKVYEQREPVTTITYGVTSIGEYSFEAPTVDTGYNGVILRYQLPDADNDVSEPEDYDESEEIIQEETNWEFWEEDTYSDAKEVLTYAFALSNGGKILRISESVDDFAQAEIVAKAKLREANEKQHTGSFTIALNLDITAGCTFLISGFGKFDGKYFVDAASHSYGNGSGGTTIKFHRCLEGDY